MYRKLASAILVASAINAKYALALGLGGMTMHSALNQPLDAEISLSSAGDLDKSQILINLASQDDFLKAGVDRSFFLSDIKFDVVLDGKGGGIIKLRSTKRLNEPYLDFLIEARWPTGRMLRSYTALVDLPVYADEKASQVDVGAGQSSSAVQSAADAVEPGYPSAAQTSRPASSSVSAARPAASKPAVSKPAARVAQPAYAGNEYQIKPNETLSHIARELKPGSGVSVNQTMLAIQKLNPHAFVHNNINLIKAGAVLRVPTEADVRQISASAAAAEVAEQTREWRGAQLDATDAVNAPVAQAPEKEEGRLRLTSAGSGLANGKDQSGADVGTQQKLNATKESLEASKLENKDLNARVKSLDSQVSQLQRMIELKDAELASLQKKLGKEPVAEIKKAKEIQALADKIAAEKAQEKPAETKPEVVPGEPSPAGEAVSQPTEAKAEPKKPVAKPKKPLPPKEEPAPEPGFIDQIKANPLYIGGVALLLIFGVVAFLFRRKAQAERQAMTENDIGNFDFDRAMDHEGAIENLPTEDEVDEFAALADAGDEVAELGSDESQATVMQTTDPIGEADIYIAYGRYDQAAELLLNAIAASPKNADLRAKLLEVYIESKNKAGFQQQYLDLRALGQSAAISHAKELLTSGGVADWLDDLPVEESPSGLSGDESSFDTFGADLASTEDKDDFDLSDLAFDEETKVQMDESVPDSKESFDLDLSDMDLAGDDFSFAETVEQAPAKAEESDFDADLTLDLSDLDLESTDTDLSFDLEAPAEAAAETTPDELDMGDLSFDLPDDFGAESLQEPVQTASVVEEPLSFDDLDMGFEEPVATAAVSADEDLSFEGFDLELPAEESVPASSMAEEDSSLDFSDMDFSLDDGSGLVSSGSEFSEEEGFDLSVEETPAAEELALESDFEFASTAEAVTSAAVEEVGFETAAAEPVAAEPHVSSPIATLESEDLEFLTDGDEVSTKLDLAQAYVDLGDVDGARDILLEVMKEGRDEQKAEAAALLDSLD